MGDQKNFLPLIPRESASTSHENCLGGSEESRAKAGAGRRVFARSCARKSWKIRRIRSSQLSIGEEERRCAVKSEWDCIVSIFDTAKSESANREARLSRMKLVEILASFCSETLSAFIGTYRSFSEIPSSGSSRRGAFTLPKPPVTITGNRRNNRARCSSCRT